MSVFVRLTDVFDKKWLRYLGLKVFDHKLIDYCTDLNDKCLLLKTPPIDNA
jgi:hypothetical protein